MRTEIFVTAGKRIAGILRHRLRAVFEAWTDVIAIGGDANQNVKNLYGSSQPHQ
jgi:hypothetical protein